MENKYYHPAEDSELLFDSIINSFSVLENKKICEVGVGSGFIIKNLALEFPNNKFYGVDINQVAINKTKEEFDLMKIKIKLKKSNLFDEFKREKFDLIFFNTPYLPCEDEDEFCELPDYDRAIYGGESGYETIEDFIQTLNDSFLNSGVCFILFSSLSNKKYVENVLKENLFEFEYVTKDSNFAFEELYVVKIKKSKLLKEISSCDVKNIKYLDIGKHSIVYEGILKNKKVIIKTGKFQHIQKEGMFLEKLCIEDFVPKMYVKQNEFVVREKVEGIIIEDFIRNEVNIKKIINVFNKVLKICFKLDKLGINKDEMTNPYKHIYIIKNKVKMIDYERCIYTDKPKNTTQFLQYIRRNIKLFESMELIVSDEKIFETSKKYKEDKLEFCFEDLCTKCL